MLKTVEPFILLKMDQSRYIAQHVVNLPKSGIRDFFDIVAKMKDAISLGVGSRTTAVASSGVEASPSAS